MNYYSLNRYCRKEFGKKLYKLALDGGMTCPNRDGTKGTGGCIFCSGDGSGDFAQKPCGDIKLQIENAKKLVCGKNKNGGYIAYFQSFTNTYAAPEYLREIFFSAIMHPDIDVLSIATRPDCLSEEIIALLKELNEIKPVWVELGLQTSNENTVRLINRCYGNEEFENAVKVLNTAGIKTVAHVILGLPHETLEDMQKSVDFAVNCGVWGLKLQLLHVLRGTALADMYYNGEFECMTLNEYLDILYAVMKNVPENIVIHRLTGDGDKKKLIAPLWSADKKTVLNAINAKLL